MLLGLRTPRLQAGPWQAISDPDLGALFAPEVVAYLAPGFHGLADAAARRRFLDQLSHEAEVVAMMQQDGSAAGLLILSGKPGQCGERHLGYLLRQSVWGQGLAGELLAGLQALCTGRPITLVGGVMQVNAASARVLERAGFIATTDLSSEDLEYRWTAGDIPDQGSSPIMS